ncbi:MAG: hypothetical protein Q9M36_11690 [Sulfurovum sp.]|nr:hypothetical protein [Sulfurovum sp.]
MNDKTLMTISSIRGIKQYTLPKYLKSMLVSFLLIITMLLVGMFYYIKHLSTAVEGLTQYNTVLTKKMNDNKYISEALAENLKDLEEINSKKLLLERRLTKKNRTTTLRKNHDSNFTTIYP